MRDTLPDHFVSIMSGSKMGGLSVLGRVSTQTIGALIAAGAIFAYSTGAPRAAEPQLAEQTPAPRPQKELTGPIISSALVTLDQERFFTQSRLGRNILLALDKAADQLRDENNAIKTQLEDEERDLTQKRATMPIADFQELAQIFDQKVENLRQEQEQKKQELDNRRAADQQRFFSIAAPILGQLLIDIQAVAIIDSAAVVLTFQNLDITDIAIRRLDETLDKDPMDTSTKP